MAWCISIYFFFYFIIIYNLSMVIPPLRFKYFFTFYFLQFLYSKSYTVYLIIFHQFFIFCEHIINTFIFSLYVYIKTESAFLTLHDYNYQIPIRYFYFIQPFFIYIFLDTSWFLLDNNLSI